MNFSKKALFGTSSLLASASILASQATKADPSFMLLFLSALKMLLFFNFPLLLVLIIMLKRKFKTKANKYILPVGIATSLSLFLGSFLIQKITGLLFSGMLLSIQPQMTLVSALYLVKAALSVALFTLLQAVFLKFIFRSEKSFSPRPLIFVSSSFLLLRSFLRLSLMLSIPKFMLLAKCHVMLNLPWSLIMFAEPALYVYMIGTFIYWLIKKHE